MCGEWLASSDDSEGSDEPANVYQVLIDPHPSALDCKLCLNVIQFQALKTLGVT